jgi:hypothetical protein
MIPEESEGPARRLARWVSHVLPSQSPVVPEASVCQIPSPLPPPKRKRNPVPLLSSSSLSLSSSEIDRRRRAWTKGPKERKREKYFFKVKGSKFKDWPCQEDATKPWQYSAKKSENL